MNIDERKLLDLAIQMQEWASKNTGRFAQVILMSWADNAEAKSMEFSLDTNSYKDVHRFLRRFKDVGKMTKQPNGNRISYDGDVRVGEAKLGVRLWGVTDLPPSCHVEYKEIEVPEETIPAYTRKVAEIVCQDNNE